MKALTLITLGLLAGWLIEWLIDWLYWRRKDRFCREENARLEAQIERLQEKLALAKSRSGKAGKVARQDDFTLINGIGPVISSKLNEAGITTFEALAATTLTKLKAILGDLVERLSDEEDLLRQAKDFAKEKRLARQARKKKGKKGKKRKQNKPPEKEKRTPPEQAARTTNAGKAGRSG